MYDNPRHKKEHGIRARLDYYDYQEFVDLAAKCRMQPAVLAREILKDYIAASMRQEQQAANDQRTAV